MQVFFWDESGLFHMGILEFRRFLCIEQALRDILIGIASQWTQSVELPARLLLVQLGVRKNRLTLVVIHTVMMILSNGLSEK